VYRLLGNPLSGSWASPAACLYNKALSLGVMSKSYGMAGLRIGWIACQDVELLKELERMKHYTSICNSAPSEVLAYFALKQKDTIHARNNQIIEENMEYLTKFVNDYSDLFDWTVPEGGCVGFMHYKGKTKNIDEFCADLVSKKGVLLMPSTQFSYDKPYFRIGFGRKNMKEALDRLREYLEENSN
jgi:aspartate/methionine/tyrosine aminotransferase